MSSALSYGIARLPDGSVEAVARRGENVLALARIGDLGVDREVFTTGSLNAFIGCGPDAWAAVGSRLAEVAEEADSFPMSDVELLLPIEVGDLVNMYSSLHHATNVGRLFRPDGDLLPANWRYMPIGYHGHAGNVVVSGTPVRRPWGQHGPGDFRPETELDFEAELAFVCGDGPDRPIATGEAARFIFGFVLLNDWSARAIQRWEYQPLGPFLGKSFATSISPWVVPLAALDDARVANAEQEPPPAAHLRCEEDWTFDIALEVELSGEVVARTNARHMYWNPAQQLAHATSNGARVRAGDLFAGGTLSGPAEHERGCLLEIGGGFLADGDAVTIRGRAANGTSFGELTGRVLAAYSEGEEG